MEAQSFEDRLKEVQGEESARSFARRIGISDGAIRGLTSGGKPTLDTLLAIANATGVELKWLATGEGPKFSIASGEGNDEVANIPRLDVVASAGPGASGASEKTLEMVPFPRAFLRAIGVSPANANIVTVAGDSMEPTLSAGDDLIVDTSVKRIRAEALYVLILDGEVVVKRAQRRVNGSILITSDNERYPPEEVTPDDADKLRVAGRVVWFGRSI